MEKQRVEALSDAILPLLSQLWPWSYSYLRN